VEKRKVCTLPGFNPRPSSPWPVAIQNDGKLKINNVLRCPLNQFCTEISRYVLELILEKGGKFNYVIMRVKTYSMNRHIKINTRILCGRNNKFPSHCAVCTERYEHCEAPYSAKQNAFQNYTPQKNNPGVEHNSQLCTIYLEQGWVNAGPRS
jgi:hypothetical protein